MKQKPLLQRLKSTISLPILEETAYGLVFGLYHTPEYIDLTALNQKA